MDQSIYAMSSYAYIHAMPGTVDASGVFYVGKGSLKRADRINGRSEEYRAIVSSAGAENILVGKIECSSGATAVALECGLIRLLRRANAPLVNKNNGGGGSLGFLMPESAKKKLSDAKKGDRNPMKRPDVRAHVLEKNRRLRMLKGLPDPGNKFKSKEDRRRAQSDRFRTNNPSSREHVRQIRSVDSKAMWANPDTKNRIRDSLIKSWTDERRNLASINNASHRPEVNVKKSNALKGYVWPRVQCPHCSVEGTANIMKRWHFDRCKSRSDI